MDKNEILKESLRLINGLDTGRCFIVGGYVRDIIMGRESFDLDFVIEKIDAAKEFAGKFNCNYYMLGADILHRVEKGGLKWDFVELRGDIHEDLAGRDFTCDTMAVELNNIYNRNFKDNIIDPFNGLKDIELKLLKPTSEKIFSDDYVRIIRVYRLKAELKFKFDNELDRLIKESVHGLKNEKGERICHELEKLFCLENIGGVIGGMIDNKIFENIYPKTGQSGTIAEIIRRLEDIGIPEAFRFVLMISAIWKDTGIGERLRISKVKRKMLKEFLSYKKDIFETWVVFKEYSETIFKARYMLSGDNEFLNILKDNEQNVKDTSIEPIISGNKVMGILNLDPSPEVGIILKDILKAQFNGEISSISQAIEYIKSQKV